MSQSCLGILNAEPKKMKQIKKKHITTIPGRGNYNFIQNCICIFFCAFLLGLSQSVVAQEVTASLDTTSIKIGEQIRYRISVETSSEDLVIFPEEETFQPLELVESFPTDTLKAADGQLLLREYALTQFDSGTYLIPRQLVQINEQSFYTDSLQVEVADVVVDTTKQKLYPIKPYIEAPSNRAFPNWGWWLLLLALLGGITYLFYRHRKKKKEAQAKLPPYEQALSDLDELDKSQLLDNREIKEYYSRLTYAVRQYLDGEVYNRSLESTTAELLQQIEVERKAGHLQVDDTTISKLREILTRADLAKFANQRPDIITAREDRARAEGIINETKEGIPEPTEEDLLEDQQYLEKEKRRKTRKKIIMGVAGLFIAACLFIAYQVSTQGFTQVRDSYLGHPTKSLLEEQWVRSEYGTPPVVISTPKVLKRGEMELPDQVRRMMIGNETFLSGGMDESYFIALTTLRLQGQQEFDLEVVVDGIYKNLEDQGASMILMKQEDVNSRDGAQGMKVFGSFIIEDAQSGRQQEKEYEILNFAEQGGYQQIMLVYDREDQYAGEITERILSSVELNYSAN